MLIAKCLNVTPVNICDMGLVYISDVSGVVCVISGIFYVFMGHRQTVCGKSLCTCEALTWAS